MLVTGSPTGGGAHERETARFVYGGAVTHVHAYAMGGGYPGSTLTGAAVTAWYANYAALGLSPKARWRASKGSAPVHRFTRAFGDNATEGWHRSMPVGIAVSAGTTATVAALFILGASSTAEARATASAVGAFVLGVAAIAQATATATTTGTLTAAVSSVATSTNSGTMSGTLSVGVTSVGQARTTAAAAARFVLGLVASGTQVVSTIGPGLVRAALTWVSRLRGEVTYRVRHEGDLTSQPRHSADHTHVTRHAADLTYKSKD